MNFRLNNKIHGNAENNQQREPINLKEMIDMLTTAHENYAARPVFFTFGNRKYIVNCIGLTVFGDEYIFRFDGETKSIVSGEMINMMSKLYNIYGDRSVKVMVNTVPWHVVDLEFQTEGRNYCFVCEDS